MSNKVNKIKENIYLIFVVLLILLCGIAVFFSFSVVSMAEVIVPEIKEQMIAYRNLIVGFVIIVILLVTALIFSMRKLVVSATKRIGFVIDEMIAGRKVEFNNYEETVTAKIESKLKILLEMLENQNQENIQEKEAIKTLIGDIAHQVNTPIANISMYNQILSERDIEKGKQKEFLQLINSQLGKLEWLIQSLIKMSRLETGAIVINSTKNKIHDVLANALSGVYLKARKKEIDIIVSCDESIEAKFDYKWTTEALFNIIDNAVKYSAANTKITINVEKLEMFSKIDIIDEGIGIEEAEVNNIFKRFYRCEEVSDIEGVGVGLYIVREIITKENGFVKISSTKGVGTCFSIFLPN